MFSNNNSNSLPLRRDREEPEPFHQGDFSTTRIIQITPEIEREYESGKEIEFEMMIPLLDQAQSSTVIAMISRMLDRKGRLFYKEYFTEFPHSSDELYNRERMYIAHAFTNALRRLDVRSSSSSPLITIFECGAYAEMIRQTPDVVGLCLSHATHHRCPAVIGRTCQWLCDCTRSIREDHRHLREIVANACVSPQGFNFFHEALKMTLSFHDFASVSEALYEIISVEKRRAFDFFYPLESQLWRCCLRYTTTSSTYGPTVCSAKCVDLLKRFFEKLGDEAWELELRNMSLTKENEELKKSCDAVKISSQEKEEELNKQIEALKEELSKFKAS